MGKPAIKGRGPESLPKVVVEYTPETRTLSIHNGLWTSDGETITKELAVFYDAEGHVAGFVLESAESLLEPFLDAILSKTGR